MKTKKAFATATGLTAALLCGVMLAPAANAQTVVVSNPTPPTVVAADVQADMVGIELIPSGIVVTGHGGDTVQVSAKGQKTRTITPKNAKTPAKFKKLKAGKTYSIKVDGTKVASTRVLRAPGQTYNMVVRTTDEPGSVLMSWDYATRSKTGDVHFTLAATPVAGQTTTDVVSVDVPGTAREGVLSGLDPHTLYKFTVEAVNDAAAGRAVDAVMTQSLATITGADEAAQQAAAEAARQAAEQAAAQKAEADAAARAAARPAPAPAPSGGGSSPAKPVAPATKTIWECPTGFEDISGVCTQTKAYTFSKQAETSPYTYSPQFVETGRVWHDDPFNPHNGCRYTVHGDRCKGWEIQGYTTQVKDTAPSGWSDNGSAYERQVDVKDATPAGWSDNGTAWVRTTAKVAREVPA